MNDFALKDSGARQEFDTGARRDLQDGKGRPDLIPTLFLTRLAVVMEKGAKKYGDRNWEQGMPLSRYYASALRHLMAAFEGQQDEDHLGQAGFNIAAFMWTQHMVAIGALDPNLNDLPGALPPSESHHLENDEEDTSQDDVAASEQYIKDYSPVIGVKTSETFVKHLEAEMDEVREQDQALVNAGLHECLDGVWRGATTIDSSVKNPGERQTPIYAQPAVFEPTRDIVRDDPETGELQ